MEAYLRLYWGRRWFSRARKFASASRWLFLKTTSAGYLLISAFINFLGSQPMYRQVEPGVFEEVEHIQEREFKLRGY